MNAKLEMRYCVRKNGNDYHVGSVMVVCPEGFSPFVHQHRNDPEVYSFFDTEQEAQEHIIEMCELDQMHRTMDLDEAKKRLSEEKLKLERLNS